MYGQLTKMSFVMKIKRISPSTSTSVRLGRILG